MQSLCAWRVWRVRACARQTGLGRRATKMSTTQRSTYHPSTPPALGGRAGRLVIFEKACRNFTISFFVCSFRLILKCAGLESGWVVREGAAHSLLDYKRSMQTQRRRLASISAPWPLR